MSLLLLREKEIIFRESWVDECGCVGEDVEEKRTSLGF